MLLTVYTGENADPFKIPIFLFIVGLIILQPLPYRACCCGGILAPVIYDFRDHRIEYFNNLFNQRNKYYRKLMKSGQLLERYSLYSWIIKINILLSL
jgi:hypothetical protein